MIPELFKKRLSRNCLRALSNAKFEFYLQRLHASGVRQAKALAGRQGLRLNLGSGFHPKPGWINVDLLASQADLRLDLREPLPFEDGSAAVIYCEHFFEHLRYTQAGDSTAWDLETKAEPSEAMAFLRECRRVLEPGGTLDLVVPDAEGILQEYVSRHERPFPAHAWWGPSWCDTPIHCVNYVFRQGREHQYAYDEETLARVLASSGFEAVRRRGFDPAMDAENHRIGSLCMLAAKPAAPGQHARSRGARGSEAAVPVGVDQKIA